MTGNSAQLCLPSVSTSVLRTYNHHHQRVRKRRTRVVKLGACLVPAADPTAVARQKCYGKKPDPSAPKITRPCSECGKKFWSWKALFGHMRCHPERQWRGINPPPNYRRPILAIQPLSHIEAAMTADDHEVASCLLLLANTNASDGRHVQGIFSDELVRAEERVDGDSRFECSSCKKVFGSHHALGGHRASHKSIKGCFAMTRSEAMELDEDPSTASARDEDDDERDAVEDAIRDKAIAMMSLGLGHQCSICLRVFSSGQALGGHKRCHWDKQDASPSIMMNHGFRLLAANEAVSGLDLNLPRPVGLVLGNG